MKLPVRTAVLAVFVVGLLTFPLAAAADHATRPHSPNIQALGHSPHPATFFGTTSAQRNINSDIAFWGNLAFNGNYDGFRIVDISDPAAPQEISWTHCNGDQGDIVVWENVLVRAWNSPAPSGRFCDGRPEADSPGCGTHTLTAVPDLANDRLVIYNATSGGNRLLKNAKERTCGWIDIVQVPLANPGAASHIRREPLEGKHAAHDNGVILGDVNMLATASGHMSNIFSIGPPRGGTLTDPLFLFTIEEPGVGKVGNWHSAAFSWDGDIIILGWEQGGGSQPECEATDPDVKKSAFFYDAEDGHKLGQWTLPRPQSAEENCTIHNYNTVPLTSGRDLLVMGNYQAGTWVADFTNPARAQTVAWSDPPPLGPVTTPGGAVVNELGGAWSSYWYNNVIYESEITKGLNLFSVNDPRMSGAIGVPHLNPQTQEFSLPF